MEQFYLDKYFNHPSNLNSDSMASGSGNHFPMSEGAKDRLRKERGISFFMYDIINGKLVFIFDSKTFAQLQLSIDHRTLNNCLNNGILYLGRFIFSLEIIEEFNYSSDFLLSLTELKNLLDSLRENCSPRAEGASKNNQSARKPFIAFNIKTPSSDLCGKYNSINEFARIVKGDRGSIRQYLNGNKPEGSLYKNEWQLTPIQKGASISLFFSYIHLDQGKNIEVKKKSFGIAK